MWNKTKTALCLFNNSVNNLSEPEGKGVPLWGWLCNQNYCRNACELPKAIRKGQLTFLFKLEWQNELNWIRNLYFKLGLRILSQTVWKGARVPHLRRSGIEPARHVEISQTPHAAPEWRAGRWLGLEGQARRRKVWEEAYIFIDL